MKSIVLLSLLSLASACDLSGGEREQNNADWFGNDTGSGGPSHTDGCPETTCSPATPTGLHFYGEAISEHDWLSDFFIDGPAPTAAGGHQRVRIGGLGGATFSAVTDGTSGIAVDSFDNDTDSVILRGTGSGSDYLRIVDPNGGALYDRKRLDGAAVESITVEPIEYERGNGQPWAFKNTSKIAVALAGHVTENGQTYSERLVDSTMTIQLPDGMTRAAWDAITIPLAASQQTVVVQAGNSVQVSLDVTVVDHIDGIEPYEVPTTLPANNYSHVCFLGLANGRPVAGLAWTFTLNDNPATGFAPNCVLVPSLPAGPLDIAAMTEGFRTTVHVELINTAARVGSEPLRRSSAGERAANATGTPP